MGDSVQVFEYIVTSLGFVMCVLCGDVMVLCWSIGQIHRIWTSFKNNYSEKDKFNFNPHFQV